MFAYWFKSSQYSYNELFLITLTLNFFPNIFSIFLQQKKQIKKPDAHPQSKQKKKSSSKSKHGNVTVHIHQDEAFIKRKILKPLFGSNLWTIKFLYKLQNMFKNLLKYILFYINYYMY